MVKHPCSEIRPVDQTESLVIPTSSCRAEENVIISVEASRGRDRGGFLFGINLGWGFRGRHDRSQLRVYTELYAIT
jgi:hypothetical protein